MPSSGTRCPGVGNDTDDGRGEEDMPSGQNRTGQRKGMQYGQRKSKATEERKGNGKGKGNAIGNGIVKQTPQGESRRSGVRAAGSKRNGTRRANSSRYI